MLKKKTIEKVIFTEFVMFTDVPLEIYSDDLIPNFTLIFEKFQKTCKKENAKKMPFFRPFYVFLSKSRLSKSYFDSAFIKGAEWAKLHYIKIHALHVI
ncbi:hypothetical protein BpHYR1_003062 [Brachionus plicatilis]|uniref:Uncharacterized protein n=1 Tax=Brachionus plicatilis TaxID=10195 RepID=A0A3M7SEF9_BRAPC|nr:hypothetical protein BpHYR1_003062 [Brachionus plicatilis]